MMYSSRFRVRSEPGTVADFHRRPGSLRAITPPPIVVAGVEAPERLEDGDEMGFTLWLGLLPIRWRARIEQASEQGFVDRQVHGPFRAWAHRHEFVDLGDGTTEVRDTVTYRLARRPDRALVGAAMAMGLPLLFAYRGWRTRRLLERRGS